MKKLKRTLYLVHRWFGVALCLVFALWFASGIVMMYVEYPELTEEERTHSLPTLDIEAIQLTVEELQNSIPINNIVNGLTVTTLLGRPVFQVQINGQENLTVFADNGEKFTGLTEAQAEKSAAAFDENADPRYIAKIDIDQWTVSSVLHPHRPLHKVALNNSAGTFVYLSDTTGQVVRDTHAWERAWNWVGSTIHWIYPLQLRRYPNLWANLVIVVSIAGIVSVLTGTIVGFLRLRVKKRYKNGSVTPYTGLKKWHHVLGLVCTLFVTMFVVSGLFSMNPFGIFDSKSSPQDQILRYRGSDYSLSGLQQALASLQPKPSQIAGIKELFWQHINGEGVLVGHSEEGRVSINLSPIILDQKIRQMIPNLLPENSLLNLSRLEKYDNYYYSTHNRYRPLPVYRATFDDDEHTWYYIDIRTGNILGRSTKINRVERWLYNGLHSLDFRFLMDNRPFWDIVLIVLSLAGILFSYTSLVIGWRRLKKTRIVNKTMISNKLGYQIN